MVNTRNDVFGPAVQGPNTVRGEERKRQLVLGSRVEREIEMVIRSVERRITGGNEDIRSEEIEDLLSLWNMVVVGVLSQLGHFPCLGLFSELGC